MCGRFGVNASAAELAKLLDAQWGTEPPPLPRFNVAPTQDAPVLLRAREGGLALEAMRWGLVPSWAKDPSIGNRMINARAETVGEKPAYRTALAKRRCLVPASGFYEWQARPGGKVPHWIHPRQGGLLTLAGLWEAWRAGPDAPWLRTFTILTTAPSDDVAALHDRMPVLVPPAARDAWLDPAAPADVVAALLAAAPAGTLAAHPVSTAVNRPAVDLPELILPEPAPA